jgi:hypothetical protein
MGVLVRSIGTNFNKVYGKRAFHWLSTAGRCVAVVPDMNQTGVTGDGGDNTGVGKIYLYYSIDSGVTWTLKATITTDVVPTDNFVFSSAVDSADNVHVVWKNHASGVLYNQIAFTAASQTYTPGTNLTIYTFASNYSPYWVEIDTLSDTQAGWAVVAIYSESTSGTTGGRIQHYFVKAGVLFTGTNIQLFSSDTQVSGTRELSLACSHAPIASNTGIYAIVVSQNQTAGGDKGDMLYIVRVNTSTGAWIGTSAAIKLGNAKLGGGHRRYQIFSETTSNTFSVVGLFAGVTHYFYQFSVDVAGNKTDVVTPRTLAVSRPNQLQDVTSWATFARQVVNGISYFHTYGHTAYNPYNIATVIQSPGASTVTWNTNLRVWDYQPDYTSDPTSQIGGANRNFGNMPGILQWWNNNATYRVEARVLQTLQAAVLLAPLGTIDDSTPDVSAQYWPKEAYVQARYKMQWQFAQDSAFTTNVRLFTQDDSKLLDPSNPPIVVTGSKQPAIRKANVTTTDTLPQLLSLSPQGIWYVRVQSIDEYGNVSPYSPGSQITVTHPPLATQLFPDHDSIVLYGSGSVQVGWTFTDPYPFDHQTSSQVQVIDSGSGTVLSDTGKVANLLQVASVTVPSTSKDVELQFIVKLWDADDVGGLFSSPAYFLVSDAPTPVITSPANGASITTAQPLIQWTSGIAGSKAMNRFRLVLTTGPNVIYDTGWTSTGGANQTSWMIPPNVGVKNSITYTATLMVEDTLGFQGVAVSTFTTNFVVPAQPALQVFAYEVDRKGFVQLGWTKVFQDADFLSWNLYRRAQGDTSWTLLATFTDAQPEFNYQDYLMGQGTYQYAGTQTVNRFGDIIESPIVSLQTIQVNSTQYWIIDPEFVEEPMPLYLCSSDSYTDEVEEEEMTIIGAGRHVDEGEALGASGSLSIQLRNANPKNGITQRSWNYIKNPTLLSSSNGQFPDLWTVSAGAGLVNPGVGYVGHYEPLPHGRDMAFQLTADTAPTGYGAGANAWVLQSADHLISDTDLDIFSQPNVSGSIWLAFGDIVLTWEVRFTMVIKNSAGTQIKTTTVQLALDTAKYEPTTPDNPDSLRTQVGNASRFIIPNNAQFTIPSTAYYYNLKIEINITNAANQNFPSTYIGGIALTDGTSAKNYFDGQMKGGRWMGVPDLSVSFTDGTYLARNQLQDIKAMRKLDHPVYLRNPFGDVWLVSLGDVQVDRVAGVGTNEFSDITVPYREVGF